MIFVSTSCVSEKASLFEWVNKMIDEGINHIEISGFFPDTDLKPFQNLPVNFLVHNLFSDNTFVINLASPQKEITKRSLHEVKRALQIASELKSPLLSIHAGFITDPVGFLRDGLAFPEIEDVDLATTEAINRYIDSLNQLSQTAQTLGVRLLVENNVCTVSNRGKLLLQTIIEFETLFQSISSPYIGILLDTGHLQVSATTYHFSVDHFSEKLGGKIGAFHLHENYGIFDEHKPVQQQKWIIKMLQENCFVNIPKIIEAKFNDLSEVKKHLHDLISMTQSSQE